MKQPILRRKHKAMANRFFIFLLCVFVLNACSKDESSVDVQSTASVSVYAAVPDAPEMNFFLNGNNIAASVPFGSFTLYNHVAPETFRLKAQTLSFNTIVDTGFSVAANRYYSLFLTDSFARVKPILIEDSFATPDITHTGFRFLVLSPGVPNIDFHARKNNTDIYTWSNRSFGDDISSDTINKFIKLAAGVDSFYAIKTNSTDTLARFTNRSFSDSANYTIMLEGLYNAGNNDTTLLLGSRLH